MCPQYLWIDTPHAYGRTTLKFWFLMGIFKFSDPMYMGSNVIVYQIQSFSTIGMLGVYPEVLRAHAQKSTFFPILI